MAGTADSPPPARSTERPFDDLGWLAPSTDDRPAETRGGRAERPVALLVTGDLDSRQITSRLDAHYQIIATTNLPAAVAVLGDVRLDFVLIDAALPDPAMMELITQVRVLQWLRDLPIICYGAARPGTAVSRLAGLAAHDVIVEPVSTDELVARISAALAAVR